MSLYDSRITDNAGYGIEVQGGATLTVHNSTIDNNTARGGDGVPGVFGVNLGTGGTGGNAQGGGISSIGVAPLTGRDEVIREVELVKGNDVTSPIVMAVTVETR